MHNLFSPKKQEKQNPLPVRNDLDLTAQEIEVILSLLKECTFKVKDIDFLYVALYKLTEQHKQKKTHES
jgi:hypothetical protein